MSHLQDESELLTPRILSPWQPPIVQRREPDASAGRDAEAAGSGGLSPALVWLTCRRWWQICLPAGCVLSIAAVAAIWLTFHPVYKAEAWLKIESSAPFLLNQQATGGVSVGAQDVFVRTQLQLIRSPVVIEPLLERPEIASIPEIKEMSNPVALLGKAISVESENDSELYRISYSASSPQDAANVVNAVLQEIRSRTIWMAKNVARRSS